MTKVSMDCAWRLGTDRAIGRTSPSSYRPTTTVKQSEIYLVLLAYSSNVFLRLV
jgi:hypothetical protein